MSEEKSIEDQTLDATLSEVESRDAGTSDADIEAYAAAAGGAAAAGACAAYGLAAAAPLCASIGAEIGAWVGGILTSSLANINGDYNATVATARDSARAVGSVVDATQAMFTAIRLQLVQVWHETNDPRIRGQRDALSEVNEMLWATGISEMKGPLPFNTPDAGGLQSWELSECAVFGGRASPSGAFAWYCVQPARTADDVATVRKRAEAFAERLRTVAAKVAIGLAATGAARLAEEKMRQPKKSAAPVVLAGAALTAGLLFWLTIRR
jgi:hypothetical protein